MIMDVTVALAVLVNVLTSWTRTSVNANLLTLFKLVGNLDSESAKLC